MSATPWVRRWNRRRQRRQPLNFSKPGAAYGPLAVGTTVGIEVHSDVSHGVGTEFGTTYGPLACTAVGTEDASSLTQMSAMRSSQKSDAGTLVEPEVGNEVVTDVSKLVAKVHGTDVGKHVGIEDGT